jgi:S1-C subfamily serine protease
VVRVDPGSAGHRGGLRAGDVITRAGAADVPDAADLRRAFAAAGDRPLILAFTRGLNRQVTALEK